jgi:hypothetical protein
MEGTRISKKVFKAKFLRVRSVGNPGKDGKMQCNRMPPAFCTVATGSWPLMIENCGGRKKIVEAERKLWRQKIEEAKA